MISSEFPESCNEGTKKMNDADVGITDEVKEFEATRGLSSDTMRRPRRGIEQKVQSRGLDDEDDASDGSEDGDGDGKPKEKVCPNTWKRLCTSCDIVYFGNEVCLSGIRC